MSVTLETAGPANIERRARLSHSDPARSPPYPMEPATDLGRLLSTDAPAGVCTDSQGDNPAG